MDIKVENYAPIHVGFVGAGLMVAGFYIILERPLVSMVLILFGFSLAFTQYRLEINFDKKYYKEYVWFFGLKFGKNIPFTKIDYFYITKSTYSQGYGPFYWRIHNSTYRYNGYLKFSETEKIAIGDFASKKGLLKRIKRANLRLQLEVKDYSL